VKVFTGRETSFKRKTWARMQPVVRSLGTAASRWRAAHGLSAFCRAGQGAGVGRQGVTLGYDHGDEGVMRQHSAERPENLLEFLRGP
jgi:hypothetical protein